MPCIPYSTCVLLAELFSPLNSPLPARLHSRPAMPRENSFSDSEGRSLTPDLDEVDESNFIPIPVPVVATSSPSHTRSPCPDRNAPCSPSSRKNTRITILSPKDRFRATVRKVIHLHRTSTILSRYGGAGAEPGVDPRRASAFLHYGHIRENCIITLVDYSAVRSSFGRMSNQQFVSLLEDANAGAREPWVKVRWINVCGISWDVISALALKYGRWCRTAQGFGSLTTHQISIPSLSRIFSTRAGRIAQKQTTTPNTSSSAYSVTLYTTPTHQARVRYQATSSQNWTRKMKELRNYASLSAVNRPLYRWTPTRKITHSRTAATEIVQYLAVLPQRGHELGLR